MSASMNKRKRSPNWLPSEKELLLNLVEHYYNVIENKKTDGVTIRSKLAQWEKIAEQYNSQTTHCSRTGETLKAQWESMKKATRKESANNRKHLIQTGGGSPLHTPKKYHILQRITGLLSISAVGLCNNFDGDSIFPAVQSCETHSTVQIEDITEPPPINYHDISVPSVLVVQDDSDTENTQEPVKKDWGDYTPQHLLTTSTSLEQLHKKKIEAVELQKQLAVAEMERKKQLEELDIEIKKQILRQEQIKTNMLLRRQRAFLKKVKKNK